MNAKRTLTLSVVALAAVMMSLDFTRAAKPRGGGSISYQIVELDDAGGSLAGQAFDINDSGFAVGGVVDNSGPDPVAMAACWTITGEGARWSPRCTCWAGAI